MNVMVNSRILDLYRMNNRGVEYSLDYLLKSILKDSTKQAFQTIATVSLDGNNVLYNIKDELYTAIIEYGNKTLPIEQNVNLFLLIAYLFPEI